MNFTNAVWKRHHTLAASTALALFLLIIVVLTLKPKKHVVFAKVRVRHSIIAPYEADSSEVWSKALAYAKSAMSDSATCYKRENVATIVSVFKKQYNPLVSISITKNGRTIGTSDFAKIACFEYTGKIAQDIISLVDSIKPTTEQQKKIH